MIITNEKNVLLMYNIERKCSNLRQECITIFVDNGIKLNVIRYSIN